MVQVEDGVLDVDMAWNTEEGYDYAYVQVSTDGWVPPAIRSARAAGLGLRRSSGG